MNDVSHRSVAERTILFISQDGAGRSGSRKKRREVLQKESGAQRSEHDGLPSIHVSGCRLLFSFLRPLFNKKKKIEVFRSRKATRSFFASEKVKRKKDHLTHLAHLDLLRSYFFFFFDYL